MSKDKDRKDKEWDNEGLEDDDESDDEDEEEETCGICSSIPIPSLSLAKYLLK
jgi:hypothetical protein